jgi:MFS family permease
MAGVHPPRDFRQRIEEAAQGYPPQFWLLLAGSLINSSGGSMVWPFLTIYIRQKLAVPLTSAALLLTVNSLAGFAAMSVAGPAVDRLGRKWVMVVSLAVSGLTLVAMILASSLEAWFVIFAIHGAFSPLLRVGGDAMVADLIPSERRTSAYALVRMVQNLGVAVGPSVGGFLAVVSYGITFGVAAGASILFALLVVFFMAETLPGRQPSHVVDPSSVGGDAEVPDLGYGPVFRDRSFLVFVSVYTLAVMAGSVMMVLLPVYAKENYGVPENQYGFIMATNAAMVVVLQYATTRISSRHGYFPVLAVGALFYGLGAGSVALGWNFPTFLGSMVILTIGEMLLVPTATTLTANLAPPDMRGRYMGIYSLSWGVAIGLGPVIGGFLNDRIAPVAIWYGTLAMGLAAAAGFLVLSRLRPVVQRVDI